MKPWRLVKNQDGIEIHCDDGPVAVVCGPQSYADRLLIDPENDDEADDVLLAQAKRAALIVAAPRLLEACERFISGGHRLHCPAGRVFLVGGCACGLDDFRAAIAEAKRIDDTEVRGGR